MVVTESDSNWRLLFNVDTPFEDHEKYGFDIGYYFTEEEHLELLAVCKLIGPTDLVLKFIFSVIDSFYFRCVRASKLDQYDS